LENSKAPGAQLGRCSPHRKATAQPSLRSWQSWRSAAISALEASLRAARRLRIHFSIGITIGVPPQPDRWPGPLGKNLAAPLRAPICGGKPQIGSKPLLKSFSRCNTMFSLGLEVIRRLPNCNIGQQAENARFFCFLKNALFFKKKIKRFLFEVRRLTQL
jgi:hypothetical protein